jgi:hypothetical protein
MQVDLHNFLNRLVPTIVLTLIPVAMIAFLTMPASLHHHIGAAPTAAHVAPQHMT